MKKKKKKIDKWNPYFYKSYNKYKFNRSYIIIRYDLYVLVVNDYPVTTVANYTIQNYNNHNSRLKNYVGVIR